jgi:murein DD-endopeptidase MepM/ murein hydrolase activator NlpD
MSQVVVRHGARCIAAALAVHLALLPSRTLGADESVSRGPEEKAKAEVCDRAGERVYDLCMAGPKADPHACVEESEDASARCMSPPEAVRPPEGPSDPKLSVNEYRIPYVDGTKVKVSRDFYDHDPIGKTDMHGVGGGPHRVVAARAGTIRFLEDSRSKNQHILRWLRNTDDCFNNYVWIEHDNGEWTKYSHMKQYTTSGAAKLRVGDRVAEGQYLGDEGAVGCASPGHLHFEVVDPPSSPTIADPSGALAGVDYDRRRRPRFSNLNGAPFQDGETYLVNPAPVCKRDADCDAGSWCNEGLDLKPSRCEPLKDDGETCDLVGGGHQCKGGSCKFSRCFTPAAAALGDVCYTDEACASGRCSDAGGLKGMCVCRADNDCSGPEYCDAGVDTKINRCRPKLANGAKCGKAGSVGNDHKCLSGTCSGFPKYECRP